MDFLNEIDFEKFGKKFFEIYASNGLGSLTKKDTEALVAYLVLEGSSNKDFYRTAIKLRVTETRLRDLYSHARLRFNFFEDESLLDEIKKIFLDNGFKVIKGADNSFKVEFVLNDSLLRMSLEHQLSMVNSYSDSSFNKNIVKIDLDDFVKLYIELTGKDTIGTLLLPKGKNNINEFAKTILKEYFSGFANEGGRATIRLTEAFVNPAPVIKDIVTEVIKLFKN